MKHATYNLKRAQGYWDNLEATTGAKIHETEQAIKERDVRIRVLQLIHDSPEELGKMCGFRDLLPMHGDWIKWMWYNLKPQECRAMQVHRDSFKTSAITQTGEMHNLIFHPDHRIATFRPSVTQAIDINRVIRGWFQLPPMIALLTEAPLHRDLIEVSSRDRCIKWAFKPNKAPKEGNLDAWGMRGTTGYHYDIGVVCDIVTIDDRTSRIKRDKTKAFIRELRYNVMDKNNGTGNLIMEGTPWHPDDAWSEWKPDHKINIYQSGLRTESEIEQIRDGYENSNGDWVPGLTKVEFGCNQELIHLNSDDQIFSDPKYGPWKENKKPSFMHIDGKYEGDHTGAITLLRKRDDKKWDGQGWVVEDHIDNHQEWIITTCLANNVRTCWMESNADKGYLVKDLNKLARKRHCRTRFKNYAESTNKDTKIQSFGKKWWQSIIWDERMGLEKYWRHGGNAPNGQAYINQIIMYIDGEELNDAPDSFASACRQYLEPGNGAGLW